VDVKLIAEQTPHRNLTVNQYAAADGFVPAGKTEGSRRRAGQLEAATPTGEERTPASLRMIDFLAKQSVEKRLAGRFRATTVWLNRYEH